MNALIEIMTGALTTTGFLTLVLVNMYLMEQLLK